VQAGGSLRLGRLARDHGGCVFIDLRDRGGLTQVVFEPGVSTDAHTLAGELRSEFCIGVSAWFKTAPSGATPTCPRATWSYTATSSHLLAFGYAAF